MSRITAPAERVRGNRLDSPNEVRHPIKEKQNFIQRFRIIRAFERRSEEKTRIDLTGCIASSDSPHTPVAGQMEFAMSFGHGVHKRVEGKVVGHHDALGVKYGTDFCPERNAEPVV